MLTRGQSRRYAVVAAVAAVFAIAVPASNQGSTVRLYNLYEDNVGEVWCGGATCYSGVCCRITPVVVVESVYPPVDLGVL